MSQSRRDSRVGLWGMDAMYSKVLPLEEAVLRNLGLRMFGETQWMILRFLMICVLSCCKRQLAQPGTLVELAWPLSSEQAAPTLLSVGKQPRRRHKEIK